MKKTNEPRRCLVRNFGLGTYFGRCPREIAIREGERSLKEPSEQLMKECIPNVSQEVLKELL